MPEKDPATYSMITYAWVIALAVWGGALTYMRKVRDGVTRRFSVMEFIGELSTSGFVGLLTFWLCEAANIDPLITAALVGISGHMGSRAIFMIETWAQRRWLGIAPSNTAQQDNDQS